MTAGSFLHIARDDTEVDVEAAERAAAGFLAALGIDVDHEDLRETPGRMARAYAELFSSRPLRLTTFANDEGYDELVLARAIPFRTVCEHHLLPFSGVAHVGYLPGERIVGLSKLARLVEHFAARPQVQERLTKQVAECLATRLRAPGVGVVLEAEHSCMTLRGVRAHGAKTGYVEPGRYDQVVCRGDVDGREFIAFWLAGGRILAGMNVNIWDVNDAIQDLVSGGRQVDPARLADPGVPLDEVAG
jgi:GTP cyclohydrolase IA